MKKLNVKIYESNEFIDPVKIPLDDLVFKRLKTNELKIIKSRYDIIDTHKTLDFEVIIDNIIYVPIDYCQKSNEVCILQTFDYANGLKKQLKIWTDNYEKV